MTATRIGTVERAARRELRTLAAEIRTGPLAQGILLLAKRLDEGGVSPRDEAALVRELRISLEALTAISPARAEGDSRDDLRAARTAREAARAAGR